MSLNTETQLQDAASPRVLRFRSAPTLTATKMLSSRQLCACQAIQADPLLGSHQCQIAVNQWRDAYTELAAVVLFGQSCGYGFTVGQHVGHHVGHYFLDAF